jgi:hypothetical protein
MSNQDEALGQNPAKSNAEPSHAEKKIELDRVQKEAAEQREETGGYQ